MSRLFAVAAVSNLLLCSCGSTSDELNETQAISAAQNYIRDNISQTPLDRLTTSVRKDGGNWRVSFQPPQDSTGGAIVLVVDGNTGNVVDGSMEQ